MIMYMFMLLSNSNNERIGRENTFLLISEVLAKELFTEAGGHANMLNKYN